MGSLHSCPVCGGVMAKAFKQEQETDICYSCAGAWFERGELADYLRSATRVELSAPSMTEASFSPKPCPNGHGILVDFVFPADSGIHLDGCPVCVYKVYMGYWYWLRPPEEIRRDFRAITLRCRPDIDLSAPGMRDRWDAGERNLFFPYANESIPGAPWLEEGAETKSA